MCSKSFWRMFKAGKGNVYSVTGIAVTPAIINDGCMWLNVGHCLMWSLFKHHVVYFNKTMWDTLV